MCTKTLSLALLLIAIPAALAQSPLLTRLETAATQTSLDAPGLKPWHLKLAVQLFDDEGKPTGQGTIEEWWAGPEQNRIVYTVPGHTVTTLRNATGRYTSKDDPYPQPDLAAILEQVVRPIPHPASTPEVEAIARHQKFGPLLLDCIALVQEGQKDKAYAAAHSPTYCLDRTSGNLRVSLLYDLEAFLRNKIGTFQGHTVATDLTLKFGEATIAAAQVLTLQTTPDGTADFTSTDGLQLSPRPATHADESLVPGSKISGQPPSYPEYAKQHHISGTVLLQVIIGPDGHVLRLTPIHSVDSSLTQAALGAVKTWVFKPFLLAGQPITMDCVIDVNFSFGSPF